MSTRECKAFLLFPDTYVVEDEQIVDRLPLLTAEIRCKESPPQLYHAEHQLLRGVLNAVRPLREANLALDNGLYQVHVSPRGYDVIKRTAGGVRTPSSNG